MIESGKDYELFVSEELRKYGYKNIRLTKTTGDFGVDIVCEKKGEKWAVQCKYYSSHVGVSAVQQAAAGKAAYGCDRAMVVTNSVFTSQARELAEANGVELWEGLEPSGSALKAAAAALAVCYFFAALCIEYSTWVSGKNPFLTGAALLIPAAVAVAVRMGRKRRR